MDTRKSATGETTKNLHLAEDTRSTLGIEWMRWVPMQLVRGAILEFLGWFRVVRSRDVYVRK